MLPLPIEAEDTADRSDVPPSSAVAPESWSGRRSEPGYTPSPSANADADRYERLAELAGVIAYTLRLDAEGNLGAAASSGGIAGATAAEIDASGGWRARVPPDDEPLVRAWLALVGAGAPGSIEHRLALPDGARVPVRNRARPVRDASGRVVALDGVILDLRERARAAAALAESEERYRAIMASLEEGITVHDARGRILTANPSAARVLGVPAHELVGRTLVEDAWQSTDGDGTPLAPEQHPVSLALTTGDVASLGIVGLRDAVGEVHWLQITAMPMAEGGAARVVCSFTDVTFARYEEEHRQRTETNFRTLIERSPEAVAVHQDEVVSYVNPKMVSLLGYDDADGILGRPTAELVYPEDRAMVDARARAFSAKGLETPATEERLLRRDGSAVPVEVTTIPIFYDSAPATLVHARDLTERKRLEAQVVMADRLASVGRLAAAVGHEINNPLAYVMANLDLALERLGEPEGAGVDKLPDILEMLREAREGADRVRHIVRDLKVFSRGETEEKTRVDPRRVLDSCVNMARGEIRQRARLVKRYDETPPVLANEARLGQVLLNLLVNAVHAMPDDDLERNEILVATRCDARGRVVIEVKDSGLGIPDDVKKRIFEPFFTTKAGGRGTGLGLSICQSIVTALGGEIAFESQVGKGTTFRVILPAATG